MGYEYIERFKKMGFGLFNHFGLYSVIGKGEWYFSEAKAADREKYARLPEKFFVDKDWARELVKTAKAAGCKYITLTTRHLDGFSLYDTRGLNAFDAPHSACGRDLVNEFVCACREEGIKPFFYHALLDWHNRDYNENFPAYIDYLVKSVEILCTNYGEIGGFWFDGKWDKPNEDWQEDRLYSTIRKYQPEAMIINNTGMKELGKTGHAEIDSVTFERGKPAFVTTGGKPIAGEVCEGINDHWGYAEDDICFKSVPELLGLLIDCRKNHCNLLLNAGLKGNGKLTEIEKATLLCIGKWIEKNEGFVYGCVPSDIPAENADLFTDGESYYAVIRGVPMCSNENVTHAGGRRTVTLGTEKRIEDAVWLDNHLPIGKVAARSFEVMPFDYGTSLGIRVAKFKLV